MVITPQDVASRINGFQLSTTSTPSIDTLSEMIAEDVAYVMQLAASKGVSVDPGSTQETYLRGVVIRLVSAKAEVARNRGSSTYASEMQGKAQAELDSFLDRAANLANADHGATDKPHAGRGLRGGSCCRPVRPVDEWRRGGKL